MRKKIFSIVMISMMLAVAFGGGVYAAAKMTLIVNGKQSPVEPLLQKGTTYLPLRAAAELLGASVEWDADTRTATVTSREVETLVFPVDDYPQTAAHIAAAIKNGHSAVCTIDRKGAAENRNASLKGIPTKAGYDRDEWPMAMCAEGGAGASVAYVIQSDNRAAGAWVGNQLEQYPDGTKVAFAILGVDTSNVDLVESPDVQDDDKDDAPVYNNCAEVRAAGKAPIRKGEPGYSPKLDRDGDGIGCE